SQRVLAEAKPAQRQELRHGVVLAIAAALEELAGSLPVVGHPPEPFIVVHVAHLVDVAIDLADLAGAITPFQAAEEPQPLVQLAFARGRARARRHLPLVALEHGGPAREHRRAGRRSRLAGAEQGGRPGRLRRRRLRGGRCRCRCNRGLLRALAARAALLWRWLGCERLCGG